MYKKTIAVALSGGVDSSFSAWILKKLGFKIKSIFIINWKNNNCYKNNLKYAIWVSNILNLKLIIIDFSKIYKKLIFLKLIKNYKNNIIPNPDINCNSKIKFKILIKYIKNLKISKLATGHYAKIIKKKKNYFLKLPKDIKKNQIYFLYKIKKRFLKKIIFPLGNINKDEIRKILKLLKFPNYKKKSSYGICFIENKNFKIFIKKYIKIKFGYILDEFNNILGIHMGINIFSIGQKRGLNFSFKNLKIYISYKYKKKNIIYIIKKRIHPLILIKGVIIKDVNIFKKNFLNNEFYFCQIKHSPNFSICKIRYINNKEILIVFNKLQIFLNTGQSIVFYKNKICIGGGEIKNLINIYLNF